MKTHKKPTKPSQASLFQASPGNRGFALVVTLTLMVLLSILALGMLSLSSVQLRTTSRSDSMEVARANALLALQIAIADLQTHAGLDNRITAPGGVLPGTHADQQMITGVWESNPLGPDSTDSDFKAATKSTKFKKWLVSGADQRELVKDTFLGSPASSDNKNAVDLVAATNTTTSIPAVRAAKVSIKEGNNPATGKYAYVVLDEGTKARINLGNQSPGGTFAAKSTALGGGQRPSIAPFGGLSPIAPNLVDLDSPEGRSHTAKMISNANSAIAYGADSAIMKDLIHNVTSSSLGVLADVANGGLKKDFNLLAEQKANGGLPPAFAGRKIYEQSFDDSSVNPDPSWDRALAWGSIFKNPNLTSRTVGGVNIPTLNASVPSGWKAGAGISSRGGTTAAATINPVEPPGPVLLPAIAKIQMSFALAARDVYRYNEGDPNLGADGNGINTQLHAPWGDRFQADISKNPSVTFKSPYDYLLHLVFSPIITLHNPYNIPLNFESLRVEFVNVPFAFQVFKNNIALQRSPVPFSVMYSRNNNENLTKRFGLTVSDTLLPGEIKVYSPAIPAGRTWFAEVTSNPKVFWDHNNTNEADGRTGTTATDTSLAKGQAGWNGASVGYDLDNLCPPAYRVTNRLAVEGMSATIDTQFGVPLKLGDTIYVKSAPIPDPSMEKRFSVEMTTKEGVGSKSRSSVFLFEYEDANDIRDLTMEGNPQADNDKTLRAPKGNGFWTTEQLFDHSSVSLGGIKNTQPFALFSAFAKTTHGGDSAGEDGLWAAKPFSFQNHTSTVMTQNMSTGHPSHYSHELALSRFPESGGIGIQADTFRGRFITGQSTDNGRFFGTMFEVPLAPFQSFASLNSAQLAAGPTLPHFTNPVGNSYAHPTIATTAIRAGGGADHSFLLNAALFDSYYFSGFQSHAPASLDGDGVTSSTLIGEFVGANASGGNSSNALPDPRFVSYFPDGNTPVIAQAKLTGDNGYLEAAAHQMIEGAFNVNSISIDAWKSVLGSMTGEDANALVNPSSGAGLGSLSKGGVTKAPDGSASFSRFRIPNGDVDREDSDAFWRAPINLTDTELGELAEEIVVQVRERGPFLSMAEFVNRQIGSDATKCQSGAIQAAIDKTTINTSVSADVTGGIEISDTTGMMLDNAKALEGNSAQGAPGYLMQSDVLAVLGNAATVRSDTFKIRTYGEALNQSGDVVARVFCEAIVQRVPDYVDASDKASATPTSPANQEYGRRFKVVSLSWLSPNEI